MAKIIEIGTKSTPSVPLVTGHYLSHGRRPLPVRAFIAADLYLGIKQLVGPTITQVAEITHVSTTSAWWAVHRQSDRAAIEAGILLLVPPRDKKPAQPAFVIPSVPLPYLAYDDAELVSIARIVGAARMRSAAAMAQAAE